MIEIIYGKTVTLRPATLKDRKPIFDWLTNSDLTKFMMGPPTYPDSPIPTWDDFQNDYKEYFFDGSQPLMGRCFIIEVNSEPIGQINHDKIYMSDFSTELDIWLKCIEYMNKGYGSDAIITLCNYLTKEFKCRKFIIAPSKRNIGAIKAYKKAGFIETDIVHDDFIGDYTDAIILMKSVK
jgi:RimJ/RimL family protein N-acetyltransferase